MSSQPPLPSFPSLLCEQPSRFKSVDKCGYVSEGILCCFLMVQLNLSVVAFGIGMVVFALRYVWQYGCNAAFSSLFNNFGLVVSEACVGLAAVGLPNTIICNAELVQVRTSCTRHGT